MDKPLGITILLFINLINGVGLLITRLLYSNELNTTVNEFGLSTQYAAFSIVFLAFLAIASAIGMGLGKRWGWWLGVFYYSFAIARYGNTGVSMLISSGQVAGGIRDLAYHINRSLFQVIFNALILLYFFKAKIIKYFKFQIFSKKKALFILAGINVFILMLVNLI